MLLTRDQDQSSAPTRCTFALFVAILVAIAGDMGSFVWKPDAYPPLYL